MKFYSIDSYSSFIHLLLVRMINIATSFLISKKFYQSITYRIPSREYVFLFRWINFWPSLRSLYGSVPRCLVVNFPLFLYVAFLDPFVSKFLMCVLLRWSFFLAIMVRVNFCTSADLHIMDFILWKIIDNYMVDLIFSTNLRLITKYFVFEDSFSGRSTISPGCFVVLGQ